jgi:hypothetical protein
MPGPIGQEDDVAAEVGGVGSLNAKLRLATSQLATIAANGGGSSSSSSSGSFAAFFPAKAALADLTPNPTTTVVGAFPHTWDPVQQSWMRQRSFPSHTDLASGASISSAGVMLWNAGASVSERIRTANAASGTTGTGLLAAGSMVYDGTVWWPKKGNNLAQFIQGSIASGGIFAGSPLVMAGLFTSGSVGAQPVVMPLVTDSVGRLSVAGMQDGQIAISPVVIGGVAVGGTSPRTLLLNADNSDNMSNGNNCLLTQGHGYAFSGSVWERNRTANAASGTTGTGLMGAGNQVYDPVTGLWHSQKGNATAPFVQGLATENAALVGNPVLVAFRDVNGTQVRSPMVITDNTDTSAAGSQALLCLAFQYAYDSAGQARNRVRNNVITNQFNGGNATSGATNHATQVNYNNSGLIATLNVTSVSGAAPTLDIKLQIADGAGTFYDLTDSAGNTVAFTQKTTTGTDTLKLQPGLVERLGVVANRQYSGQLPRSYRFVSTVAGNLMNFTYRLDVSELK